MREPPYSASDHVPPTVPPMPEPMPHAVRRPRQPSQSLSASYDSMPMKAVAMTVPVPVEYDDQPSIQVRALKRGQIAIATGIITGSFVLSRVLGILRTSLLGYAFGSNSTTDAFYLAFTVPNAVYNLVAGGALSSAFIPVFIDYMVNKRDKRTAWIVTSAAFNFVILALVVLAGLAFIFMNQLAHLYAFGVFNDPQKAAEVILLSRIMLLQPILLGISVVSTSVLQARQRFLLPAVGSVLYNVGQIGGIAATIVDNRTHIFGGNLGILGPTYGVVAAAAMQLLIQIPGLFTERMRYSLTLKFWHPGMITVFKLMAPRFVNSLVLYVGTAFVTTALLSTLAPGAVYGYQTAFTLVMLPISVFGMALSQAAFPTLATLVATRDWVRLRETVLSSVRVIIYLSVPAALGMMVLAEPIVRLLLVHGSFTSNQAATVFVPMIFFAVGIPGLALIEILVRAYYALQDARTAVTVGIVELFFVVGLSIILLDPMKSGGVALATAVGSIIEASALLLILRPRIGWFRIRPLINFTAGVISASLVAALAALLTYTLLEVVIPTPQSSLAVTGILAVQLVCAAVVGSIVYYLGARFLGIDDTLPIDRVFGRIGRRLHLAR